MFLPAEKVQEDCLRQGDILEGLPFPLMELRSLQVLGKPDLADQEFPYPKVVAALCEHRKDPHYFTGLLKMRMGMGAVVSHCCELEPDNGKMHRCAAFSVARVIPLKSSMLKDPEKLASIRGNGDPRIATAGNFLNYFYIEPHVRIANKELMVDFSQVFSIPASEFPAILKSKVLQMDDRSRVMFKIKYSAYLSRLTPEEEDLKNPWEISGPSL